MREFFKFPHTPHLAWLGSGQARNDKIMTDLEVRELFQSAVVVEEKLDGANIGISAGDTGTLAIQNRGRYLERPYSGQFSRLDSWLASHRPQLEQVLSPDLVIFGEWCAAVHSIEYDRLPDWFLLFDVYERTAGRFWSADRRNALAQAAHLEVVPELYRGRVSFDVLRHLLMRRSAFSSERLEGAVLRLDSARWLEQRAKIVNPAFVQAIDDHWSKGPIRWNRVVDRST